MADPEHGPGPGPLTAEEVARRPWVLVAIGTGRPIGLGQLLSMGLEPRVLLVLDHFSSVPSALRGTPNLAVVPFRLVAAHPAFAGLRSLPCPWPTPPFRMAMHWDSALEHDAGHRWFRNVVAEAATAV